MKILSLSEENVKKISAVELTLDDKGNLVIVAGNNEQGKSSLLDGIEMALNGGSSIPPKPVRRGQEKATVEMTLGTIGLPELTVKRTITANGGGSLVVTNKEGTRMTSPQAVLDALVGKLSFDPLAFSRMKPAEKSETIRKLLGLDFSKQENERDELFGQRTEVNRRAKAKESLLSANKRYPDVPKEELSSAEIIAEQEQSIKHNSVNVERRRMFSSLQERAKEKAELAKMRKLQCEETDAEIGRLTTRLKAQTEEFKKAVASAEEDLKSAKAMEPEIAALKDVNIGAFVTRLNEVEYTNNKIRKNKDVDKIESEFKDASKEAEALTKKIDAIDRAKRDAIAAAKFPVPGMSLGDVGEVLLDGLPFEQASTKGQLMASLAMGAALNPKLRVMLVRSGNDLDDNALKLLAEWVAERDYQIWLERISTTGKVAVIIEDGHAVTQ